MFQKKLKKIMNIIENQIMNYIYKATKNWDDNMFLMEI